MVKISRDMVKPLKIHILLLLLLLPQIIHMNYSYSLTFLPFNGIGTYLKIVVLTTDLKNVRGLVFHLYPISVMVVKPCIIC